MPTKAPGKEGMGTRGGERSSRVQRQGLPSILLGVVILGALGLRLWLSSRLPIESDEAIVGLMARHILEGERPVFYYGQQYLGALEAYLAAILFLVGEASTFWLRLVPIAFFVAFCAVSHALASRLYGRTVAIVSTLYLAVAPVFLVVWSFKARGGIVEVLFFGALLLLLLDDIAYRERMEVWRVALLGFVAGLAFWVNQLILAYVIVVTGFLLLKLGARVLRVVAVAGPAFLLGSLPLWIANVQSDFGTFRELFEMHSEGAPDLFRLLRQLASIAYYSAPVMLGFAEPNGNRDLLQAQRATDAAAFILGTLAAITLAALALHWLVTNGRRGPRSVLGQPEAPLLTLGLIVVGAFALSRTAPFQYGDPRYLLPLYSLVPFFAAYLVRARRWTPFLSGLILIGVLALNLRSTVVYRPEQMTPTIENHRIPVGFGPLIAHLLAKGETRIYANYWIAYSLAFETREQIIGSVIDDQVRPYANRYTPYVEEVDRSALPSFVFLAGSNADHTFGTRLADGGVRFERAEVGGYAVYEEIDPPQWVR